jgi:hypothetical protein
VFGNSVWASELVVLSAWIITPDNPIAMACFAARYSEELLKRSFVYTIIVEDSENRTEGA